MPHSGHATGIGAVGSVGLLVGALSLSTALLAACSSSTTPNATVAPTAQAVATSAAPTVQAIATQAAPTAQALATSAAPTARAVATNAAPTAQAVETNAAPTAQALATQAGPTAQALATTAAPTIQAVATQAAPIGATVTAAAPVRVADARVTTNDAMVTLQNTGQQTVNLSGWSLQVGTARTQLPQGFTVPPAKMVNVHTTSGSNTDGDLYLGQDAQALATQLQPGATIALADPSGGTVSSFVVPNG
jgi:Lamin Tail Domain